MQFTFVKTQLVRFPNIQGWYLKFDPQDKEMLTLLYKMVNRVNVLKSQKNPHIKGEIDKGSVIAMLTHPITLSAQWLYVMVENSFNKIVVLVNEIGGWMPLDKQVKIMDELTTNVLIFPIDKRETECITISRFPDGKHWYIDSSNELRSFDKYISFDNAYTEAKKYVSENCIIVKDTAEKIREGD